MNVQVVASTPYVPHLNWTRSKQTRARGKRPQWTAVFGSEARYRVYVGLDGFYHAEVSCRGWLGLLGRDGNPGKPFRSRKAAKARCVRYAQAVAANF